MSSSLLIFRLERLDVWDRIMFFLALQERNMDEHGKWYCFLARDSHTKSLCILQEVHRDILTAHHKGNDRG